MYVCMYVCNFDYQVHISEPLGLLKKLVQLGSITWGPVAEVSYYSIEIPDVLAALTTAFISSESCSGLLKCLLLYNLWLVTSINEPSL